MVVQVHKSSNCGHPGRLSPNYAAYLQGQARGKNKDYPYGVNQHSKRPYAIGLWGDLPYSGEQAAVIPNVIADMNARDLAFTAHDGDLRQGSGSPACADGMIYTRADTYFGRLFARAIFTPGDDDWTDCDRQEPRRGRRQLSPDA